MREAAFINRNKTKWERLEKATEGLDRLSADEANDLYIELTDDLSYARTFYPSGKVTQYLNGLSARVHQFLGRNRPVDRGRYTTFWTTEVPLAMAATRKALLLSALIFGASVLIGAVSTAHDTTFARLVLGEGYVNMTLDNISNGRPMDVYDGDGRLDMFMAITLNNVRVAFIAFAAGVFTSLFTGVLLVQNGIMLGVFQYFFHQYGLLEVSALTIWIHGTLEISAIVIAGAAGITMGNGWLFPGTHTRLRSFQRHAMLGLKVAVGLVPVFVIAGFLESFVTRHSPYMNTWVSASIIVGSLAFIIWYFIVLPYRVEHRFRAATSTPPSP